MIYKTIAITGSRTWTDKTLLKSVLQSVSWNQMVVGDARGADFIAAHYAHLWGRPHQVFKADWETFGKAAGMLRNRSMLDNGKPDLLIAFRHGRSSKGTDGCVKEARSRNIPVLTVEIPQ